MYSGFSFKSGSGKDGPLIAVNRRKSNFPKLAKITFSNFYLLYAVFGCAVLHYIHSNNISCHSAEFLIFQVSNYFILTIQTNLIFHYAACFSFIFSKLFLIHAENCTFEIEMWVCGYF